MYEVIYVDDDKAFLELTKDYLEGKESNLDLKTFISPKKALSYIKENEKSFDCVVSDYQMPKMNGLELLQQYNKKTDFNQPFIIFTGKGREEVAMKALNRGADRYIQKRGDPQSQFNLLKSAIYDEIEKKQKNEEIEELYSLLKSISEINQIIVTSDNFDQILNEATTKLHKNRKYLETAVALKTENNKFKPKAHSGKKLRTDWHLNVDGKGNAPNCVKKAISKEKTVVKRKVKKDCEKCGFCGRKEHSSIVVPLHKDNELKGFLFVITEAEKKVQEKEKNLLKEVGQDLIFTREKILTEEKLRKRKRVLSEIIEGTPVPTFVLDKNHRVRFWNRAIETITGYNKEKLLGTDKPWKPFYNEKRPVLADLIIEKQGKKDLLQYYDKINNSILENAYYTIKHFPQLGEEGKWVYATACPLENEEGEIIGAIETLQDITERKDVEKKLKKLQEIGSDLVNLNDKEKICEYAVEAAEKILDFTLCDIDLLNEEGKLVPIAVSSEIEEEVFGDVDPEEAGLGGKTLLKNQSYLIKDLRELEDAKPIRNTLKSAISVPIGDKGVFQAISNEKNYYDEKDKELANLLSNFVQESLNRAEEIEKREILHSLLRHDVQNKMQVIKGYLELIDKKNIPENDRSYLIKGLDSVKESESLINQINFLNEVEKIDKKGRNIQEIIKKAIKEQKKQLEKKEFNIELDLKDLEVLASDLTERIFNNLIKNSLEHSNGSFIRITTRDLGKKVRVTIEDDGKGVADEDRRRLFKKGYCSDENGSGLGLYISKKIMENLDGKIEAKESELGGLRINLYFKKEKRSFRTKRS